MDFMEKLKHVSDKAVIMRSTYTEIPSPDCERAPIRSWTSNVCYQLGDGRSYFLECNDGFGSGNDSNTNANGSSDMYIIGAIVCLLVFIFGAFGGYMMYKRRIYRKRKITLLNPEDQAINGI